VNGPGELPGLPKVADFWAANSCRASEQTKTTAVYTEKAENASATEESAKAVPLQLITDN